MDPYLLFYFHFIHPVRKKIEISRGDPIFSHYVPERKYSAWKGLAFEFLCFQSGQLIAEKLGFGAVNYEFGSWFSRNRNQDGGQIDLLFIRADRVITLCEIKFQDGKVGKDIMAEVEKKRNVLPNPKGYTIETVLISASPVTDDLAREKYFNRILLLENLFD